MYLYLYLYLYLLLSLSIVHTVGFSQFGLMIGSDAIIGSVNPTTQAVTIIDYSLQAQGNPPSPSPSIHINTRYTYLQ